MDCPRHRRRACAEGSLRAAMAPRATACVRLRMRAAALASASIAAACAVEPLPQVCPELAEGELVITEIRGPQQESDSLPQWIEIANVSGRELELRGLQVVLSYLDGSGEHVLVLRQLRTMPAAAYFALGLVPDNDRPADMDYGLAEEYDGELYGDGIVRLQTCGDVVDAVVYRDLTKTGSWALGVSPPSAEANDAEDSWCVDDTAAPEGSPKGLPGTPGKANPSCE